MDTGAVHDDQIPVGQGKTKNLMILAVFLERNGSLESSLFLGSERHGGW